MKRLITSFVLITSFLCGTAHAHHHGGRVVQRQIVRQPVVQRQRIVQRPVIQRQVIRQPIVQRQRVVVQEYVQPAPIVVQQPLVVQEYVQPQTLILPEVQYSTDSCVEFFSY